MAISKKDFMLLLGLLGVLTAVLVYFLFYLPYMEKSDALEKENGDLAVRILELEEMEAQKEEYIAKMEDMNQKINEIYDLFPSNVMAEDAIYLAVYEEAFAPLSVNGITIEPQTVHYQPVTEAETDSTDEKGDAIEEATADSQADLAALEADAELEGTSLQTTPDASATDRVLKNAEGKTVLYNQPVTISYELSYDGLKRCMDSICTNPNRMTISNVAVAYNNASGLLSGNMSVNMYYLTGNGKPYTPPDFSKVLIGNTNLFGSIVLPAAQVEDTEGTEDHADGQM